MVLIFKERSNILFWGHGIESSLSNYVIFTKLIWDLDIWEFVFESENLSFVEDLRVWAVETDLMIRLAVQENQSLHQLASGSKTGYSATIQCRTIKMNKAPFFSSQKIPREGRIVSLHSYNANYDFEKLQKGSIHKHIWECQRERTLNSKEATKK